MHGFQTGILIGKASQIIKAQARIELTAWFLSVFFFFYFFLQLGFLVGEMTRYGRWSLTMPQRDRKGSERSWWHSGFNVNFLFKANATPRIWLPHITTGGKSNTSGLISTKPWMTTRLPYRSSPSSKFPITTEGWYCTGWVRFVFLLGFILFY